MLQFARSAQYAAAAVLAASHAQRIRCLACVLSSLRSNMLEARWRYYFRDNAAATAAALVMATAAGAAGKSQMSFPADAPEVVHA